MSLSKPNNTYTQNISTRSMNQLECKEPYPYRNNKSKDNNGYFCDKLKVYRRYDKTAPITGGVSRLELFRRLWNAQKFSPSWESLPSHLLPRFNQSVAELRLKEFKYIDTFYGKCIECDFSSDMPSTVLYDQQAGDGTFAKIAFELRKETYRSKEK